MEKNKSFNYYRQEADLGLSTTDRRLAYVRQASYNQLQQQEPPHTPISIYSDESAKPFLSRTVSSIDIQPGISYNDKFFGEADKFSIFRALRSGNRQMRRLFLLISLNVAYSTAELGIGLLTGRVGTNLKRFQPLICLLILLIVSKFCFGFRFVLGLVSDAFHLTFGCGLLTFSMFAMAASRKKPDCFYTYGYD